MHSSAKLTLLYTLLNNHCDWMRAGEFIVNNCWRGLARQQTILVNRGKIQNFVRCKTRSLRSRALSGIAETAIMRKSHSWHIMRDHTSLCTWESHAVRHFRFRGAVDVSIKKSWHVFYNFQCCLYWFACFCNHLATFIDPPPENHEITFHMRILSRSYAQTVE